MCLIFLNASPSYDINTPVLCVSYITYLHRAPNCYQVTVDQNNFLFYAVESPAVWLTHCQGLWGSSPLWLSCFLWSSGPWPEPVWSGLWRTEGAHGSSPRSGTPCRNQIKWKKWTHKDQNLPKTLRSLSVGTVQFFFLNWPFHFCLSIHLWTQQSIPWLYKPLQFAPSQPENINRMQRQ